MTCARFADVRDARRCRRPHALAPAAPRRLVVVDGRRRRTSPPCESVRDGHRRRRRLPGQRLPGPVARRCPPDADLGALAGRLAAGNPAPYAGVVRLPTRHRGRHRVPGAVPAPRRRPVESRPIKGTAPTADELLPKDEAENVMIVDLVRNDLGRVVRHRLGRGARPAARSSSTPAWSTSSRRCSGRLRRGVGWPELCSRRRSRRARSPVRPSPARCAIIDELEPVRAAPTAEPSAGSTPTRRHGRAGRGHPHLLGRRTAC